jgi:hypothetical protein
LFSLWQIIVVVVVVDISSYGYIRKCEECTEKEKKESGIWINNCLEKYLDQQQKKNKNKEKENFYFSVQLN